MIKTITWDSLQGLKLVFSSLKKKLANFHSSQEKELDKGKTKKQE